MRTKLLSGIAITTVLGLTACQQGGQVQADTCKVKLFVLGNAQDGGKPQIGSHDDPGWTDPNLIAPVTSLGLSDRGAKKRYLFDATPDIRAQSYAMDRYDGNTGFAIDGVFLTHGHIGHYLGLAHFGREALGAKGINVYAMPKMAEFLSTNGPWEQLVSLNNITLRPLTDGAPVNLSANLKVTPFLVPHRGEYTETVGYQIQGPGKSAVFIPDIDSWEQWDVMGTKLEDVIAENDLLFIDGTFYDGNELPGRDMSKIPHPTMVSTMTRLTPLDAAARAKIKFIHLNHTNPAHDKNTVAFDDIEKAGYQIAITGSNFCLD